MTRGRKIAVMLVDDHPLFRAGLAIVLRRAPELDVVRDVGDVAAAVEAANRVELDLAIIDLQFPSGSGIWLVAELRKLHPRCTTLVLSSVDEPVVIADVLRAGAAGFAVKSQPIEEIIAAIRTVLAGERSLPSCVSHDAIGREMARHARQ